MLQKRLSMFICSIIVREIDIKIEKLAIALLPFIVMDYNGIPFVAILQMGEQTIGEQTVNLIFADTFFDLLEIGRYTALVKHELVSNPFSKNGKRTTA